MCVCVCVCARKRKIIFLAYDLCKKTANCIMMLYKNSYVIVRSPDGHTDSFDIFTELKIQQKTLRD